jgi:hypothetical protein
MGSFANSLHVKCGSDEQVADAIRKILADQGWRPTTKPLPDDGGFGISSPIRGLHVSAPTGGWVSILDSDLGGVHALTSALAARLETHAIFFLVNDSDAWSYLLAGPGGEVSEFDSMPEDGDDFDQESLAQLNQATNTAMRLQSLMRDPAQMQRMQQLGAEMLASAPPEIRALEAKMKSGQFNAADMQRYHAWSMEQMPKYLAQLDPSLGSLLGAGRPAAWQKSQRKETKAQRAAQQKRLDELRPLFAPGVSDEQVQDVFDSQTVFAEELLAEFLPLLGIPDHYAYLSYRYLDETTPAELSAHGIRFLHDLRFESGPRLRVFSEP